MTHEMVYLAFPGVPDQHLRLEEGLATYIEPLAQFGTGQLDRAAVQGDLVQGLPKGLPKSRDQWLDLTRTWGQTFWGDAMFCTSVDVEIRKRTQNQYRLEDALCYRQGWWHAGVVAIGQSPQYWLSGLLHACFPGALQTAESNSG